MFCRIISLFSILIIVACTPVENNATTSDPDQSLKELVQKDSKSDLASDLCDEYGWYNDAFCDQFCQQPDPACAKCENMDNLCLLSETPTDTDDDGCPDICVPEEVIEPPEPSPLGATCDDHDECAEDAYCARPAGTCNDDAGVCTAKTTYCGEADDFELLIVCGCDGYDHATPCDAEAVGVNIDYVGFCGGY
jgi:hypothetical protein